MKHSTEGQTCKEQGVGAEGRASLKADSSEPGPSVTAAAGISGPYPVCARYFNVYSSAALQPLQRRDLLLPSSQHLVEGVFADGSPAGGR